MIPVLCRRLGTRGELGTAAGQQLLSLVMQMSTWESELKLLVSCNVIVRCMAMMNDNPSSVAAVLGRQLLACIYACYAGDGSSSSEEESETEEAEEPEKELEARAIKALPGLGLFQSTEEPLVRVLHHAMGPTASEDISVIEADGVRQLVLGLYVPGGFRETELPSGKVLGSDLESWYCRTMAGACASSLFSQQRQSGIAGAGAGARRPCLTSPGRVLVVGLGGGSISSFLCRMFPLYLSMDVIEHSSAVTQAAIEWFGLQAKTRAMAEPHQGEDTAGISVLVGDALDVVRRLALLGAPESRIESLPPRYDAVLVDLYSQGGFPIHCCSDEFYRLLHTLCPQGCIAVNLGQGLQEVAKRTVQHLGGGGGGGGEGDGCGSVGGGVEVFHGGDEDDGNLICVARGSGLWEEDRWRGLEELALEQRIGGGGWPWSPSTEAPPTADAHSRRHPGPPAIATRVQWKAASKGGVG